jgi:hypothetical protein
MQGGIDSHQRQDAPLGRALVLTGSVGSGHTRAAQAVAEAMLRSGHAEDAEVVDVLGYAWPAFRALYRDAYIRLIERAPGVVGWLYRSSDTTDGGGAGPRRPPPPPPPRSIPTPSSAPTSSPQSW